MLVKLTMVSGNKKTGPVPVTTTEEASCPSECSLKDDCYAKFGPIRMHWKRMLNSDNWDAFCNRVTKFPKNQLWRHCQAGDLPKNKKGTIHFSKLKKLVESAKKTCGFTYTHYNPLKKENAKAIKFANENGFTINLSADNTKIADKYYELGIGPVVTILHKDASPLNNKTPKGRTITVCPAQTTEDMNCARCGLCQIKNRKTIVGFLAHSVTKNRISERLEHA